MSQALRTYLYAPCSEPRKMRKALEAGADAVVFDLEDAVMPSVLDIARQHLAAVLSEVRGTSHVPIYVRPSRAGSSYAEVDLGLSVDPDVAGLRVPKADAASVAALDAALTRIEVARGVAPNSTRLDLIIESALACRQLDALAAGARVDRLALGGADLAVALGVAPASPLLDHVAAELVVVSAAAGLAAPIDRVHTDVGDLDGLRQSTVRARELGFGAKSLIHPSQIEPIRAAFEPTAAELDWATRILDVAAAAGAAGSGVGVSDGEFVDAAVVARATQLLSGRSPS